MVMTLEPVAGGNVSAAWLAALRATQQARGHETTGLVVQIDSQDGEIHEDRSIRAALDGALRDTAVSQSGRRKRPALVGTVASTIFPRSMWNPSRPRGALFERYERALPRIRRFRENHHGTYFERFIGNGNQLDHIIATRVDHSNYRRSAYQLAVFDPGADHGNWKQRGFPCLHQVSFVPDSRRGALAVFAYYPTQTVFEKAYGNYVGLWHLGQFVGHEWGLQMTSLTCIAVVAKATSRSNVQPRVQQLLDELQESR